MTDFSGAGLIYDGYRRTGMADQPAPCESPYFFFLEASNDLLMDVPGGSSVDGVDIQIFPRTEHLNQQWTFLPVFAQLGNEG